MAHDERVKKIPIIKSLLRRPESASIVGFIFVTFFFLLTGDIAMFSVEGILNWTTVAAYLGVLAVGACLLMIAGEFDLSIGSMIGFAGVAISIPTVYWGLPISVSLLLSLLICLFFGYLNGYLVVRTGLPSFIITLALLFILRGLTLALSILFTNQTIVSGLDGPVSEDAFVSFLFKGYAFEGLFAWLASAGVLDTFKDGVTPVVQGVPKVIIWCLIITAIGTFVLNKTRLGNWIFASGGDAHAARNVGVPADNVKIVMFMTTAFCAWLFAVLQVVEIGSASADRGLLKEFEAIIAVVIGGALLTGGYGSIIGAFFGAIIFGMVQMGITYTDITSDWFRVFLGLVLLAAVLFNNYVRQQVMKSQ